MCLCAYTRMFMFAYTRYYDPTWLVSQLYLLVPGIKTLSVSITLLLSRRMKTTAQSLRNERLGSSLHDSKESCTFTQASLNFIWTEVEARFRHQRHHHAPPEGPNSDPWRHPLSSQTHKVASATFEAKRKAPIWKSKDSYRSELLPNSKNQFSQMWPQNHFRSSSKEITPWAEFYHVFFYTKASP